MLVELCVLADAMGVLAVCVLRDLDHLLLKVIQHHTSQLLNHQVQNGLW